MTKKFYFGYNLVKKTDNGGEKIMDKILGFVQELLTYLNEGEAADIVGIVKNSGVVEAVVNFFKGIFEMFA